MKIAFQMEPMAETLAGKNNTLRMMEEACVRGHDVYHYEPETLSMDKGGLYALLSKTYVDQSKTPHYEQQTHTRQKLNDFDVVFFRQDPPVDMAYVTNTYLLERLKKDRVVLVNDPFWIRNMADKISIFDFPDHIPPTLISRSLEEMSVFFDTYKDIVVKPLYGFHGHGIFRTRDLADVEKALQDQKPDACEPLMLQPFLPEIKDGNKRIVFFDGEIVGALRTIVPDPDKEFRIYRDSIDEIYTPTKDEEALCKKIGALLKERGLLFVGIDLIGSYLTEINVGSVGSIVRLDELYQGNFSVRLFDIIEKKVKA